MISLILPVYNVEEYIKECLESILCQTYKDYQLIVVDDGSTDKSLDIVYSFEKKFKNINILKQRNKGVSEARNLALDYVKGEYILYIDSDDFLDKEMLQVLLTKAEEYKSDVTICEYYLYYSNNLDNRNIIQHYDVDETKVYESKQVLNYMLEDILQGQLWHKLFRTNLLKSIDIKFAPGRYIQDIFPVFKAIANSNRIVFVKKPLYYYRQRETSTVHKKNIKIADDFYFAAMSIMNYVIDNKINVNQKSFDKFYCKTLLKFIMYYLNANEKNNERTFRHSKYNSLQVKNYKIIFKNNINLIEKLKIILWNLGMYSKIKKLKVIIN
ncbi:glycosyltransferase family 2 protein [Clostridium butyricum]|uniref:glycosyltransferase family 2 protein n=1 Tax=Clostridium butyricum TaxID=1492 RepID=UPI003D34F505